MDGILVPRAFVAAPVSPGVRAVSMFLAVAPCTRVAVPVDPGERAVPMLFVVAPRAHISTPASPIVRAMSMSLAIAPRACVGASINAYDVSPDSLREVGSRGMFSFLGECLLLNEHSHGISPRFCQN